MTPMFRDNLNFPFTLMAKSSPKEEGEYLVILKAGVEDLGPMLTELHWDPSNSLWGFGNVGYSPEEVLAWCCWDKAIIDWLRNATVETLDAAAIKENGVYTRCLHENAILRCEDCEGEIKI